MLAHEFDTIERDRDADRIYQFIYYLYGDTDILPDISR